MSPFSHSPGSSRKIVDVYSKIDFCQGMKKTHLGDIALRGTMVARMQYLHMSMAKPVFGGCLWVSEGQVSAEEKVWEHSAAL